MNGGASYPEAAKLLTALMEGVLGTQYLEIRTIKKGGGAKKKFHALSQLRKHGFDTALPRGLDGKQNIYYGVAPRYEALKAVLDSDRGDAVDLATSIWFDEITRPAPDLPPLSWMVETSIGKVQGGYLLDAPTSNLDQVEDLNRRLRNAVGGDNVWNRGRILRLPGFINLNHPGDQRARLLEFHPDRRYSLDDLDRLLPQESHDRPTNRKSRRATVTFDPHWPCPLPQALQNQLADFLTSLNLRPQPDGRLAGSCPLPHRNGVACDCDQAFYASPVSGSWSCFCSDHEGQASGTIRDFAALGLETNLSLSENQGGSPLPAP